MKTLWKVVKGFFKVCWIIVRAGFIVACAAVIVAILILLLPTVRHDYQAPANQKMSFTTDIPNDVAVRRHTYFIMSTPPAVEVKTETATWLEGAKTVHFVPESGPAARSYALWRLKEEGAEYKTCNFPLMPGPYETTTITLTPDNRNIEVGYSKSYSFTMIKLLFATVFLIGGIAGIRVTTRSLLPKAV